MLLKNMDIIILKEKHCLNFQIQNREENRLIKKRKK